MQLSIETSMHEFYEDVGPFWYLYLLRWERASLFAWYKTNIGENNLRYRKKKKERPSSVAAFFLPGSKLCRAEQVFLKISRSVHINRVFLCFFALYPNVRLCSNKCIMSTTSVERWYSGILTNNGGIFSTYQVWTILMTCHRLVFRLLVLGFRILVFCLGFISGFGIMG